MTADVKRQLLAAGAPNPAPAARSPAGPSNPTRAPSAAALAKEQAARAEAVGTGRLAWVNEVFGLPVHYRKYRLLSAADAEALDEAFYQITNARP